MPSIPFRNTALVIAAKNYEETVINVFWSSPFLLDFFTLSHYFFSVLCTGPCQATKVELFAKIVSNFCKKVPSLVFENVLSNILIIRYRLKNNGKK